MFDPLRSQKSALNLQMGIMIALIVGSILLISTGVVALRSRHHKRHVFAGPLISASAIVDRPLNPEGSVFVHGELWLARSANGNLIPTKTKVTVIGSQDHLLLVT